MRVHGNCSRPRRACTSRTQGVRAPGARALGLAALVFAWVANAGPIEDARRLSAEGQNAQALEQVRLALADNPNEPSALLLEGVLLSRLGKIEEAIARFERLSAARPDLPEPYNNLAVLFAGRGEYEKARQALVQAVRLQPEYDLAHENLGDVYTQLAAEAYQRAAETNAENTRAREKALANERILGDARMTRPSAPVPATETASASPVPECVRVAGLATRERAEEVEAWLDARGVSGAFERIGRPSGEVYRVYVPPLASPEAADAAATELRTRGVKDLMVMRSGAFANGISLGVFSSRRNAERQRERMARYSEDVRIAASDDGGNVSYIVTARARPDQLDRADILAAFPESRVTFSPCRS